MGLGVEDGREVSDLQLLAKLQHFGAATGRLDFTWSPLVALWFASDEYELIKMGGRLVRHSRRLIFQLSEVPVPRRLFEGVLDRIGRLSPAPS